MILEVAILPIKPNQNREFESAFKSASTIIASMPGYISHELQKSLEIDNQYLLLVQWNTIEDHSIGFRKSKQYQAWKELLHRFYEPFPQVEYYQKVL